MLASTVALDPNRLQATRVKVSLNARAAKTGLIFATQAMTGPSILDVVRFPEITFVSRQVHLSVNGRLSGGARVSGDLTLRGVTRPISLQAALHRPVGSSKTDLDHLTFRLTGQLSRAAFGPRALPPWFTTPSI